MFGMSNTGNALKGSPFEVFLFLERARKPEGARVGRSACSEGDGTRRQKPRAADRQGDARREQALKALARIGSAEQLRLVYEAGPTGSDYNTP